MELKYANGKFTYPVEIRPTRVSIVIVQPLWLILKKKKG